MGLKNDLLNRFNLTTQAQAEARATERATRAYEAGFNDANDEPTSGTLRSYGYRKQTAAHLRDLKVGYEKIIENVWLMYQSNPVAKRMLRIKVSHFLGAGIDYTTDDDTLKELLDEFWDRNNLKSQIRKFALQLRLWGEQIYPVFIRQKDGRVNLGYIDPGQVEAIVTHPDNAMWPWMVVLKDDHAASGKRAYRVIRKDDDYVIDEGDGQRVIQAKHPGLLVMANQTNIQDWELKQLRELGLSEYTGSCFLFQINNVSNQNRGFSDLLQSGDWVDVLDDTLFGVAEREQFAGYFSWDVKLINATPEQVRERRKEIAKTPPSRGSVRVHNDAEEWTLNWPDLKQMGSIETVKALLAFIMGGLGFPLSWFGFGDGTNRATALAQSDPTTKTLEEEQDEIRDMIISLLTLVRDQAIIAGTLPGASVESEIEVTMPQLAKRDLQTVTASMSQLATALVIAEQQGWSTNEQAITIWQNMVQELGVEPDDVQDLLDAQPPADGMATAESVNDWLANRLNGNA